MSAKELEIFQEVEHPAATPAMNDSVLPVVESGQAMLVTSEHVVDDEIWLEPTPGHTPDHFAVRLASRGENAVIGGDLMHSPVQCLHHLSRARILIQRLQPRAEASLWRVMKTSVLSCA